MKKHPAIDSKDTGGDKNLQAGTDIQNSEASYRSLFDAIGSAALIVDPDTTAILHANPAACKFYGYSHNEFIQLKILDLAVIPPEDVWQRNQKITAGELTHMTFQHRLANGEIRDVDVDLGRGFFNGRAVNIATMRDVTEQKQSQQKLQESEKRLHTVLTAMSEGVVVQVASGEIVFCNPQAESILGLTAEQIMGRTSTDSRWLSIHEDGSPFPGEEHPAMISLRTGKPCHNIIMGVYQPDESPRWISINSQPIFLYTPEQPSAVVATFVDVTGRKQMEQNLRDSEEKFRAIIDAAREGVILVDEQGIIIEWNAAQELLTGMRRENVIGRPAWEVQYEMTSPEGRKLLTLDMIKQMILKFVETGQVPYLDKPVERHVFTASSEKKLTLQHVFAIPASRGYRICTFLHDITERKQTEQELQVSEARFRQVLENSLDAAYKRDLKTNTYEYLSPVFERITGYTPDEFEHLPTESILNIMHADDIPQVERVIAESMSGTEGTAYQIEYRFKHKDGQYRWLQDRFTVMRDAQGQLAARIGSVGDITQRKQAEDALRESEQRLKLAVSAGHIGIWDWDIVNDRQSWDDSQYVLYGLRKEEFSSAYNAWIKTLHPDDRDYADAETQAALRGEREYAPEFRIIRGDGQVRFMKAAAQTLYDENGKALRMIGVNVDITKLKQAEATLQAAHDELEKRVQERTIELKSANIALDKALRAKDEFMSAMSHELRTPLTGILGMVETLQLFTYGELNPKQMKSISFIEQGGRRLLDIVNNVLDFTRLQSSTLKLGMRPCSLNYICLSALKKNTPLVLQKKQRTSLVVTPPELILQSDEHSLYKMLQHLLNNAEKFTPEGGEFGIEVLGRADEKQVDITVWDTGIGIAEEDFPRLFQPFVQLDARLAREYEGAGLGLALVKKKAELLGGDVKVESAVGKGSRFTVTLPWK